MKETLPPYEGSEEKTSRRNILKQAGGLVLGVLGTSQILKGFLGGNQAHALEGSMQNYLKPIPDLSLPTTPTVSQLLNVLKGHPDGIQAVQRYEQSRKFTPTFSPLSLKFTPTKLKVGMHALSFGTVKVTSDSAIMVESKGWSNANGSWAILTVHFPHLGNYLIDFEGMVYTSGPALEANIREAKSGLGFYSGMPFQRWTYPSNPPSRQSFPAVYSITQGTMPTKRTLLFRVEKGGRLRFLEASVQSI